MLWIPLLAEAGTLNQLEEPLRTGLTAPRDAAVVIGIETYLRVPPVQYARRDANLFHDWLVYTRGVPTARVHLIDNGATREAILRAIQAAAQEVEPDGRLWIYFAGHGAASPDDGERLWLGDDVAQTPESFAERSVRMAEIRALIAERNVDAVIISDACYSGRGRGGELLTGDSRFVVPTSALPRPMAGIVQWDAAAMSEVANPLHPAEHGAFTWFLVGALRGWADGERDGVRDGTVSLEEANLYVSSALRSARIEGQRPVILATDLTRSIAVGKEQRPNLDVFRSPPAPSQPDPTNVAQPTEAAPNGWEVAAAILTMAAQPALSGPSSPEPSVALPPEAVEPLPDTSGYAGRWVATGSADVYVLGSLEGQLLVDTTEGCISALNRLDVQGVFAYDEAILAGTCTPWSQVVIKPASEQLRLEWLSEDGQAGAVLLRRAEPARSTQPSGQWSGYFYSRSHGEKVPAALTFSGGTANIDYLLNDCDNALTGLPTSAGWKPWRESAPFGCTSGEIGVLPLSTGSIMATWSLVDDDPMYWGIFTRE